MQDQVKQVEEFYKSFGLKVSQGLNNPQIEVKKLRQSLIQEEVDELNQAQIENDHVGVLDAIIDCMYILVGTAIEWGIQDKLVSGFNEVHRSNMSKLDDEGNPIYREDGKIIKSKNYSAPNLKDIIYEGR